MLTWRPGLDLRQARAAARNRELVQLVREYQDHLAARSRMDPRRAMRLVRWIQRLCVVYVSEYRFGGSPAEPRAVDGRPQAS